MQRLTCSGPSPDPHLTCTPQASRYLHKPPTLPPGPSPLLTSKRMPTQGAWRNRRATRAISSRSAFCGEGKGGGVRGDRRGEVSE